MGNCPNCPLCGRFMRKERIEQDDYNKQALEWWECNNHDPRFILPQAKPWSEVQCL